MTNAAHYRAIATLQRQIDLLLTRVERLEGIAVPTDEAPTIELPHVPEWLVMARGELGVAEVPGKVSNPRIQEYLSSVGFGAVGDETAWCSAFCAWSLRQAGYETRGVSGMARSWLRWGAALESPRLGAVTVLWRGKPEAVTGHVGIYVDEDDSRVRLLGGNQVGAPGGCVSECWFPKSRVLGYRWPG